MTNFADLRRRAASIRGIIKLRQAFGRLGEEMSLSNDEVMLLLAVGLGQIENRPMDISALASTTNIKWATAHRLLKNLRNRGLVNARQEGKRLVHYLPNVVNEAPSFTESYQDMERAFRSTAGEISNLDNQP